jgi:anti-sigma factor RsiW
MRRSCPDKETLLLYAEGELTGRDAEDVGSHVADCKTCAETVSGLRAVGAVLRRAGLRSTGGPGVTLSPTGSAGLTGASRLASCPDTETIAGYVDGSLEGGRAGEVEKHLVSCRTCLGLVADLWAMSGVAAHDAPDSVVAGVLARLEGESRTAVLRWTERSIELVRDFASAWTRGAGRPPAFLPEPAMATSRSSGTEVRLHWSGEGGSAVEGVVRAEGRAPSLTCRVTVGGTPAVAVSAVLSSDEVTTGPESLDADGRFGPWPLGRGENILRLTGLPAEAGDTAQLVILLAAPGEEPE